MTGGDLFSGLIALVIGFVGGYFHDPEKPPLERLLYAAFLTAVMLIVVAVLFHVAVTIAFNPSEMHHLDDLMLPFIKGGIAVWSAYSFAIWLGFLGGWLYADYKRDAQRK